MKLWFPLLALLALVGCQAPATTAARPSDRLTPEQVLTWAQLDQTLANPRKLAVGQADGQAVLGEYVTLLNGAETKRFLRKHGYAKTQRTLAVRPQVKPLPAPPCPLGTAPLPTAYAPKSPSSSVCLTSRVRCQ